MIAETLDDRDIAHLKEAFNQYDTDGDGTISIVEMRNALTHGKSKLKNIDQNFLDSLDIDGDGMIDYSEFLVATMRTKHWHTTERLRLAFDQLDVDNSGQLDRDEVRSALGGNDDALADEIINQFDVDGDGTRKNNLNETVVCCCVVGGGKGKEKVYVLRIRIVCVVWPYLQ